jgi:hypothetical protein
MYWENQIRRYRNRQNLFDDWILGLRRRTVNWKIRLPEFPRNLFLRSHFRRWVISHRLWITDFHGLSGPYFLF